MIRQQHPFEPLAYLPRTLRLTFAEGIQMLNDAGYEEVRPQRGRVTAQAHDTGFRFKCSV